MNWLGKLMCGRYVIPSKTRILESLPVMGDLPDSMFERYNVAPTNSVPIIVDQNGLMEFKSARWGFIPHWWKDGKLPTSSFNARSEEAASKPMWRESLKKYRCLIPAVGWYEWRTEEINSQTIKQPYLISNQTENGLINFAGLFSIWKNKEEESVYTCSILTKEASPAISHIHNRMPVVIGAHHYLDWLTENNSETVKDLIINAETKFEGYQVNTRVNNVKNDDKSILERVSL